MDAFFAKLLTAFTHESTSFLDCVTEGNGRNEGTVHFITYRALHAGRTALIGRHRRMSPDYTSDDRGRDSGSY